MSAQPSEKSEIDVKVLKTPNLNRGYYYATNVKKSYLCVCSEIELIYFTYNHLSTNKIQTAKMVVLIVQLIFPNVNSFVRFTNNESYLRVLFLCQLGKENTIKTNAYKANNFIPSL